MTEEDIHPGWIAAMEPTGESQTGPEQDLRRRAEEKVRGKAVRLAKNVDSLSPGDVTRLLHELRVQQIELEMQNDELRRAQGDLEASRARYFDLYDLAPVGYFTLDEKGIVREANVTAASLLGVERRNLLRQPLTRFILREDQDIYYGHRKRLFETKEPQVCELRMARKDSNPFWARIDAVLAQDFDGAPVCRATMSDNTTLKAAETALRESEEKFRALANCTVNWESWIGPDGKYLWVNPAVEKIIGYSADELLAMPDFGSVLIAEEERPLFAKHFQEALRGGRGENFEFPYLCKDGSKVWLRISWQPIFNGEGKFLGTRFSGSDITAKKEAEARERLAREVLEILNRSKSPTDTVRDILFLVHKYTGFEAVAIRLQKDGDFPYYITHGFSEDFVETERSLCARDEEGNILHDGKGNPVLECMCGNILCGRTDPSLPFFTEGGSFWSNRTTDLLASTMEENRQARARNRCNGEGYESVALIPLKSGREIIGLLQFNDRRPDRFTLEMICFLEGLGTSIGIALSRKRLEASLRESEERFRALSENAPDIIFTLDLEGAFTYVNPAWKKILGHEKEEVIGTYFTDFAKEEDRRTYRKLFKNVRDEGKTVINQTGSMLTKSGEARLFIFNTAPNRNMGGQLINVVGSIKDITEMRKVEAQLLQAMKMEALGTLAGGMAHDFNNLLMGIQGNASLALMDLDSSYPQFEYLKSIESEVRSAANLTKQLLGLASIGRYEVKPTDMNRVIKKTVSMFGRMKKEIIIHWKYGEDLWPVEADGGQMEQVFMNLFVNAWQAMPGGGTLFIETKNRILDEEDVTPYTAVPGKYVKLSVTDTGVGIDEKTKQRIFEPFFTTKEMGRGTGLGLSIVYGIIKGHKGFIHVYSEPGQGTTFNIYLPASGKEILSEKPVSSEIVLGQGTVLLVDDEASVLRVNTRMLERLGYTVLPASNGEEALALYREKRAGIDLVLLDLVMPGMSGGQVFDSLREMDPDIKVILLSGYSIDGEAHTIMERGCNGFLQKPVSLSELSRKIKDMLDT